MNKWTFKDIYTHSSTGRRPFQATQWWRIIKPFGAIQARNLWRSIICKIVSPFKRSNFIFILSFELKIKWKFYSRTVLADTVKKNSAFDFLQLTSNTWLTPSHIRALIFHPGSINCNDIHHTMWHHASWAKVVNVETHGSRISCLSSKFFQSKHGSPQTRPKVEQEENKVMP